MTDESISSVPLVEVIDALRADLKTAQANSDPDNPLIVENIEVELQVVVTKNVDVNGKAHVGFSLFGLGKSSAEVSAKGAWTNALTQKIKLTLSAKSLNSETGELEKTKVSDRDKF
ncbi:MAG: hypothetical protein GQ582_11740 [Methyloprofundus sp.]|nr:hypothetical protein [Methyloprofundus sp.]